MAINIMKKLIRIHKSNHYLPEEIILKILIHLPVEDLGNFKSVSKLWYSLISNPNFAKTHFNLTLQQQQQQDQILFTTAHKFTDHITHYYHFSFNIIPNNTPPRPKQLRLHVFPRKLAMSLSLEASCDGLLLFQDQYNPQNLYISNPVIAHLEALPSCNSPCFHWGLVRDTRIDKYKVVGIRSAQLVDVLTLGDKTSTCWSTFRYWPLEPQLPHSILTQFILVQKEMLWLTTDRDNDPLNSSRECYYLYRIDVEALDFTRNKVPLDVLKPCNTSEFKLQKGLHLLTELKGGSLGLITVSPHQLQLFVLEDKSIGVWTKSHAITLQSLPNLPSLVNGFMSDDICPIAMGGVNSTRNLNDLLKILVHHQGRLWLYDMKTQELRRIGFLSQEQKLCRPYFFHSNSLARWD